MKKITKLSDLSQIDGQTHPELDENQAKPQKITRLDQLIGSSAGLNKYGTIDSTLYKSQLDKMNLAELRTHTNRVVGLVPSATRERLIKQLMVAFQKHCAGYNRPENTNNDANLPKRKLAAALDIMKAVK
jgi:hypothetical protein